MTLTQAVLEIFCSQASIGLQCNKNKKSENGNNSAITNPMNKKQIWFFLVFIFIPHTKFQDPLSIGSKPSANVTHIRTDGQAQTNMSPQLLRSWRHKNDKLLLMPLKMKMDSSK